MNFIKFIASLLLVFASTALLGQTKLPDSQRQSTNCYVYKVSKENLREIHIKSKKPNEDMLQERLLVTSFPRKEPIPPLERGNYLIVEISGNQLIFRDHVVDNLFFKIIPGEPVLLYLYDSLGCIINNAGVKKGNSTLKFNPVTQTYNMKKLKDEEVIEIDNKGVFHYVEIEKNGYRNYRSNIFTKTWKNIQRTVLSLFDPDYYHYRQSRDKYTGFIVFSKPKYKPGETVKFKAYMTKQNGTPYRKPINVRLSNYRQNKTDTTLITDLTPYRPGMYQYEFKLSDSLNLNLDCNYFVALKTNNENANELRSSFRYEDYELKNVRFSIETEKEKYTIGDTIKLKLRVKDENQMAVYGGRTEILVTSEFLKESYMPRNCATFIPDTLWQESIDMAAVHEKEIIIPDTIFPKDATVDFLVTCTYLSDDNEKIIETQRLNRKVDDFLIDFSLKTGILSIKEIYKGVAQQTAATITIFGEDYEQSSEMSVMLPYELAVPWYASDIDVDTENTADSYSFDEVKNPQIDYTFYAQNDSIYFKIDNPANIPFWYVVRKGSTDIAKGYNTQLSYTIKKERQEAYRLQLKYVFGGKVHNFEESIPVAQKNINMEIETPTLIYPGQKATVSISVVDKKGKPVENADITAYAFTSKFQQNGMPDLVIKGQTKFAEKFNQNSYEALACLINNESSTLTWNRWRESMVLDTIEYYKFLYPDVFYNYTEPTNDGSTLIAPYVVIDGALQGVHLLWVDNILHYVKQAQQKEVYTFKLSSGLHNLRFRTGNREITVNNVEVKEGAKNIFSFDAGPHYSQKKNNYETASSPWVIITSKLLKKKERGFLTQKETEQLTVQLITVNNVFGTVKFPNTSSYIEQPMYISTGNVNYFLNPVQQLYYNYALRENISKPILAGPFPFRSILNRTANMGLVYVGKDPLTAIQLEGGYAYTLYDNFQKMKSWEASPINKRILSYTPTVDFKTRLLSPEDINDYFLRKIKSTAMNERGVIINHKKKGEDKFCNLQLYLGVDSNRVAINPSLILIMPVQPDDSLDYALYYGGTRDFNNIPEGEKYVYLIFNDTTSYRIPLSLFPNGKNYLSINTVNRDTDKSMAEKAFNILHENLIYAYSVNPYNKYAPLLTGGTFSPDNLQKGIVSGTVTDVDGEPIIGATVTIIGNSKAYSITDINGHFALAGGVDGDKIIFSFIGCVSTEVGYISGYEYLIVLKDDLVMLEETVVTAYGSKKRFTQEKDLYETYLQGRVAGVAVTTEMKIRGAESIVQDGNPLIIINGLPYDGKIEDIDPSTIVFITVLKDQSAAVAIYGSRAANGVIIIQTNKEATSSFDIADMSENKVINSIRRNFHDDAFWQPSLRTDKKGQVSFEVVYPDDITAWQAHFLAIGNRHQTDKKQLTVQSFKTLTARLSTPQFAVRGDSFNAIGRIANHNSDSIVVTQTFTVADEISTKEVGLRTSFVEQIPVKAEHGDSLTITYSLQKADGYFDGEERKLPIVEQGLWQTSGEFKIISDTTTMFFIPQPELGTTTLYAEASSLDVFLREIDNIDRYPYSCNEQMASKIKALLLKKRIFNIFGKTFKEDNKITDLINRLNSNRNSEGLWGWWNKDKTALWISKQVIEAMVVAEEAGYKMRLDKAFLAASLEKELKSGLTALALTMQPLPLAKQELLDRLILLKQLGATVDYYAYYIEIKERLQNNHTTADKLKEMLCLLIIDKPEKVNKNTLMHYAHETLLGTLYWGDNVNTSFFGLPYDNNTSLTLMAYDILKRLGGNDAILLKIRNYFFECRRAGSWQNTYEASCIIEAILPEMIDGETYAATSMFVNDKKVNIFPHTEEITGASTIVIKKTGTLPLYVTSYQKGWTAKPAPESSKGFVVKTHFNESKDTTTILTAGTVAKLEVTVTLKADAEYVQIEVPIPSGCSYESKNNIYFGKETYREYFKEKVVIFCNKLTQGEHMFTIELLPRYTGKYTLNSAKAELMYFPVFYGNEEVKKVEIIN